MAFLSIIRRWALREHLSIREIARRTKLSRNTIRNYLRSGAVEPKFSVPERPSKLDPYATKLLGWLKTEAGKSRKERRTAKQLHENLVKLGYTGSYGRVKELKLLLMERMLGGELTAHLGYEAGAEPPSSQANRRNGGTTKRVKGLDGEMPLTVPRDRDGSFEPELVKKGQTRIVARRSR